MSRSFKKVPIVKDASNKKYWSKVRKRHKQDIRQGRDLTNPKEIINDYDYIDHWTIVDKNSKYLKK